MPHNCNHQDVLLQLFKDPIQPMDFNFVPPRYYTLLITLAPPLKGHPPNYSHTLNPKVSQCTLLLLILYFDFFPPSWGQNTINQNHHRLDLNLYETC